MLVSCLMPSFNRFPHLSHLVNEAVECFLRQTYTNSELLICNDTPGQHLVFDHPRIRVINTNFRYPTLGAKLHWMLTQANGEYICRWDDDDISLPWRLELSVERLRATQEWRPENHWYYPRGGVLTETKHPGNTHIMAIWHRNIILNAGVDYPGMSCPSGLEDQTFTRHLRSLGYRQLGDLLPLDQIFYLYRWGVQPNHLSGRGGGDTMQRTYEDLNKGIVPGEFHIKPMWQLDYTSLALATADACHSS